MTTKLDYHKLILDTLKDKKLQLHTYQTRHQRAFFLNRIVGGGVQTGSTRYVGH
jgi:hypothetical protein